MITGTETTMTEHERICDKCDNWCFCKYREEVAKAEDTINEFKKSTKDFPVCLLVNLTCMYKRGSTIKTLTNLEMDYAPRRSNLETGYAPQRYEVNYCSNENNAR